MTRESRGLFTTPSSIPVVFVTALILYGIFQYTLAPAYLEAFHPRDNDDMLRLLSVRDMLAGQNWYDKVQHRILPPQGLELHWSRLIDGILAAGSQVLRLFTDAAMAERLVAAIWPALLFVAFLGLTARAADRARGPAAAAFAMIAVALLPVLNISYFSFSRVDHHNVQLVCMIGLLGTMLLDNQHRRAGFAGGAFAAISVSVGLEMLPFIAVCLLVMVTRFLRDTYGARDRMLAFGLAFGALTALLFAVEVPPWKWQEPHCDRLALPIVSLALGTLVFVFLASALARNYIGVFKRLLLTLVAAVVIGALIYPMASPCLAGPFASVPDKVQADIVSRILENTAAWDLITNNPRSAITHYLPYLILLPFLLFGPRDDGEDLVAVFVLLGLLGAAFQLRALIWGVVVLPLGYGLVMDRIVNTRWRGFRRIFKPFIVIGLTAVFLYPPLLYNWNDALPLSNRTPQDQSCNTAQDLRAVGEVPNGLALTPLGLSVPLIFFTGHSVSSAPYHTRGDAHENGVKYHTGTPEELLAGMDALGADFVVVCSGSRYGSDDSAGTRLARGERLDGLVELELENSALRVLFQPADLPVLKSDQPDLPVPDARAPVQPDAAPALPDAANVPTAPDTPDVPDTPDAPDAANAPDASVPVEPAPTDAVPTASVPADLAQSQETAPATTDPTPPAASLTEEPLPLQNAPLP